MITNKDAMRSNARRLLANHLRRRAEAPSSCRTGTRESARMGSTLAASRLHVYLDTGHRLQTAPSWPRSSTSRPLVARTGPPARPRPHQSLDPMQSAAHTLSSLKTERTGQKTYRSRDEAKADVFDYIERFYNPKRRHSTMGYLSPMEFERRAGFA